MSTDSLRTIRIASIGGDGIGPEVVDAALPTLIEAARSEGVRLEVTELDWGGDRHIRTGEAMPENAVETLREYPAVLLGAVGHPDLTPELSVWSLTLPLRKALDLYVNLRPIKAWEGVYSPIKDVDGTDFVVVRENTEGEYAGVGGRVHQGHQHETASEVGVHTRTAIERVTRYAFDLARERGDVLSLVTKSNVLRYGYALWDDITEEVGAEYPDVEWETSFVDAMAARVIQAPTSLGVLLCSNMFGDIISDCAAPIAGGLGMAPSGNISPDTTEPGVFESVHGSAPDIAGKGIADPMACILSGAMLLRDIGLRAAADALESAVAAAVQHDEGRTPDLGGKATTTQASEAVVSLLSAGAAA